MYRGPTLLPQEMRARRTTVEPHWHCWCAVEIIESFSMVVRSNGCVAVTARLREACSEWWMGQRPWQSGTLQSLLNELVTQVESVGKVARGLISIETRRAATSESGGATRGRIYGCTEEEFSLGQGDERRARDKARRGVFRAPVASICCLLCGQTSLTSPALLRLWSTCAPCSRACCTYRLSPMSADDRID